MKLQYQKTVHLGGDVDGDVFTLKPGGREVVFISRPGVMRGRVKTPPFRVEMKRLPHRHVTTCQQTRPFSIMFDQCKGIYPTRAYKILCDQCTGERR